MISVLGKQMYLTEMHTSTLDSIDLSKPHSNLEGFGLSPDNEHLLTHVHQCMYLEWKAGSGLGLCRTRLNDFTSTFHFHAIEKEMATYSSVLAWRIPGTAEPGGLLSMGSQSWTRLRQLSSSSSNIYSPGCATSMSHIISEVGPTLLDCSPQTDLP